MERSASIWIVDDDEDVRLALESFLRSAGCEVRTFDRADGVLRALKVGAPDCVVTDLHMPGMDGLALQEELNALGRSFPVIVMTAFANSDAKKRSITLGASAFLSKPIDPEELLRMVQTKIGAFDD